MDLHSFSELIIHATQAAIEAAPSAAQYAAEAAPDAAVLAAESHADPGLLGTLGIDWKLFLAQLVNFGIIVFVLWKWVLGPISSKLQARTEKIQQSLIDAERVEKEKQSFAVWRQEETVKARKEAAEIIASARDEADHLRNKTLAGTKDEQSKIVEQAKMQIEQEKKRSMTEAKGEIADLVTSATEKILREKIDDKKDKGLIDKAIKNLS